MAVFSYAGTGGALVRRFKLDADAGAGMWLARAMAMAWRVGVPEQGWQRAALVPVPLHWRRRRRRGFDQARWLAREIGRRLGMPVADGLLLRSRENLPQGDPRVTSRDRNVEGVFAVRRARRLAGRRFVLVDDVFTSGATARACAQVLRVAGAVEVAMLAGCRS
ncbi:MAG: ComF family protein [Planctomycetes bacterium]|nr:ComF family protein [Planctomycetota bacterium]